MSGHAALFNRLSRDLAPFDSAVLTVIDDAGHPFLLPVHPRTVDGVTHLDIAPTITLSAGPASLLCHQHNDDLWDQRSLLAIGEVESGSHGWTFRPQRLVPGEGFTSFPRVVLRSRRQARRYLRRRKLDRPRIDWDRVRQLRDRGRAGEDPKLDGPSWERFPREVEQVMRRFRTANFASVSAGGTPQAWPVCPFYDPATNQLSITSSIGLSSTPLRVRRNPRVAVLFSNSTGSGLDGPPIVLLQGQAVAPDHVLTPGHGFPDDMMLSVFGRQQPGIDLALQNPVSRWLMDWYLMRLPTQMTPTRIRWWPHGDLTQPAQELTPSTPEQEQRRDVR